MAEPYLQNKTKCIYPLGFGGGIKISICNSLFSLDVLELTVKLLTLFLYFGNP